MTQWVIPYQVLQSTSTPFLHVLARFLILCVCFGLQECDCSSQHKTRGRRTGFGSGKVWFLLFVTVKVGVGVGDTTATAVAVAHSRGSAVRLRLACFSVNASSNACPDWFLSGTCRGRVRVHNKSGRVRGWLHCCLSARSWLLWCHGLRHSQRVGCHPRLTGRKVGTLWWRL